MWVVHHLIDRTLLLGLTRDVSSSGLPPKVLYAIVIFCMDAACHIHSVQLGLIILIIFWRRVQIMKLLIIHFFCLYLNCALLRPDILRDCPDPHFPLGKETKFYIDTKLHVELWLCLLSSSGFLIGYWKTNDSELKGFDTFVFHS